MPRAKKRSTNVATAAKRNVQNNFPEDEIQALRDAGVAEAWVRLMRQGMGGQLAFIKGAPFLWSIDKILSMPTAIQEEFGGGRYRVDLYDASDVHKLIESVPAFFLRLEGAQIVSPVSDAHPTAKDQRKFVPGQVYDPQSGQVMAPIGSIPIRELQSQPSDAVALQQLEVKAEELRQERALREQERVSNNTRAESLQRQLLDLQKQLAEAENRRERDALAAKIEGLTAGQRQPHAESNTLETVLKFVAAVTPFVPVFQEMVRSGRDSSVQLQTAQQAAQNQAQIAQMELLKTFVGAPRQDMLTQIVPIIGAIAPIAKLFMENRSPDKMAELMTTMTDTQLQSIAAMKTMYEALTPEDNNPMASFLHTAVGQLMNLGEQMVRVNKPQAPQQIQAEVVEREQQQVAQPQQAPTQSRRARPNGSSNGNGNGHTTVSDAVKTFDGSTVNYFVRSVMGATTIPRELRTQAWEGIYFALHSMAPPEAIAKQIAAELNRAFDAGKLPALFAPIYDSNSPYAPSVVLQQLLAGLPIADLRPAYVQDVLQAFDGRFVDEPQEVPTEDQGDDGNHDEHAEAHAEEQERELVHA